MRNHGNSISARPAGSGGPRMSLALRIQNQAYEKTLPGQNNFEKALPARVRNQARLAI